MEGTKKLQQIISESTNIVFFGVSNATPRDRMADLVINAPIGQVFSQIHVE